MNNTRPRSPFRRVSFLLILIFVFSFSLLHISNANSKLDSLYSESDVVLIGQISEISGGFVHDLGTENFWVSIEVDTILKQNFWINTTPAQIIWEVSNLNCDEVPIEKCVSKYRNGTWVFFLNRNHFYGGTQIPDNQIYPYTKTLFDSLIEISNNKKLVVNHFYNDIACGENCELCNHIQDENWKKVERYISKHSNDKNSIPWNNHKRIKWTLTDRYILASLPSSSSTRFNFITDSTEVEAIVNYQVGYYKAYATWIPCILNSLFNMQAYKYFTVENVDTVILRSFEINTNYSQQYLEFEKSNNTRMLTDTTYAHTYGERMPLPDDYVLITAVFEGQLSLYEDYKTMPDYFDRAKSYIDELEKQKKVYLLSFVASHTIPEIAEYSLKALERLNDVRCIPFLIYLAEFKLEKYAKGWENSHLHESYFNTLINTLDALTGCETHPQYVPYGMSGNIFDISLSIPIWKSKYRIVEGLTE